MHIPTWPICPIWMADKPHVQSMALKILSRDITLAFIRNRKEQAQGVWLGTFIHNNPPGCNVPIWCAAARRGRPARLRGGNLLPYMAGEGGRGGPAEVEKNLSTPYPNFESRHPLGGEYFYRVLGWVQRHTTRQDIHRRRSAEAVHHFTRRHAVNKVMVFIFLAVQPVLRCIRGHFGALSTWRRCEGSRKGR